ncbi:MAG: hypothetical protein ACO230_11275 [Ilumatobacteraceae bacterium]|jgi:uncharacterized membrane protein
MVADGKRAFWLHQAAEYVVGGALVASGLQSIDPLVPTALGALIVINAAVADAPLAAFRKVGRRLHRLLDYVLVVIAMIACALPDLETNTRLVQILIVLVLIVVVARTDYSAPTKRGITELSSRPDGRADEIGRLAGRTAGTVAGRLRARMKNDDSA